MNGLRIKINDVKIPNGFDMVKLVVKVICISKNLKLSETELHGLTYFVINGYNKTTREALISTKLHKNKYMVANMVHAFRKYGIIVKTSKGEELNPDFNIPSENIDVIKLELFIKK